MQKKSLRHEHDLWKDPLPRALEIIGETPTGEVARPAAEVRNLDPVRTWSDTTSPAGYEPSDTFARRQCDFESPSSSGSDCFLGDPMQWLELGLTAIALTLFTYGLYLAWTPLAFLCGGALFLRLAWSFDGGDE